VDKLVVRFETDAGMIAYECDCDKAVQECKDLSPKLFAWLPKWATTPLDAFLFALRHGPVQRALKDYNLPEMSKSSSDKNGETIGSLSAIILARLLKMGTDEVTGQKYSFDIRREDFNIAVNKLIRRAPEFDTLYENAITTKEIAEPRADVTA
jgi:hypothetical protein